MSILEPILKFLADLAWPGVALTAVLVFREPLRSLLGRIQHARAAGVSIDAPIPQTPQDVGPTATSGLELPASPAKTAPVPLATSPLVAQQEEAIRKDLAKIEGTEAQIKTLTNHLAAAQLNLMAEVIYRMIFGSQIAILNHLNLYGRTAKAKLAEFYDAAAARDPWFFSTYPLDPYLAFLVDRRLISAVDGDAYEITELGRAFLEWMVTARVTPHKPG